MTATDCAGNIDQRGTKTRSFQTTPTEDPLSLSTKRLAAALADPRGAFHRLKDFGRIATRYDRLARNYLASVCLAAALAW